MTEIEETPVDPAPDSDAPGRPPIEVTTPEPDEAGDTPADGDDSNTNDNDDSSDASTDESAE
jgi:hypothetical protein